MKRDLLLALDLLQVVEKNGGLDGIAFSHLLSALVGRHGTPEVEDLYHLEILVSGGYLTKTQANQTDPTMFQLTWKGHDYLDDHRDGLAL